MSKTFIVWSIRQLTTQQQRTPGKLQVSFLTKFAAFKRRVAIKQFSMILTHFLSSTFFFRSWFHVPLILALACIKYVSSERLKFGLKI